MAKQLQLDSISKSGNSFGAFLFGKYEKLFPQILESCPWLSALFNQYRKTSVLGNKLHLKSPVTKQALVSLPNKQLTNKKYENLHSFFFSYRKEFAPCASSEAEPTCPTAGHKYIESVCWIGPE